VPVDIFTLCDFIDYICANLVFYRKRRDGNLHNLTLPRSWIINLLSHSVEEGKDLGWSPFADAAFELLRQLYYSPNSGKLHKEMAGFQLNINKSCSVSLA
jgi:hypothetical protein